jgi:AAA15 family ATPase/GTPase
MSLKHFLDQLEEFATNNISALMGTIQVTTHERETLKEIFLKLSKDEQVAARDALRAKGVDTEGF